MASSRAPPAAPAGPSSGRINPLIQPVPAFARTTRSMTSHNLSGQPSRASSATAASTARQISRGAEAGKPSGRWNAAEAGAASSSSRAGAGRAPAASTKGKERAPAPTTTISSPNGSGRPRKSARRSKEDAGSLAQFLPPPPVQPLPHGRRLPRTQTSSSLSSRSSSSLSSLASMAVGNENVPFMPEPEDDDDDDDLNIQPSPRKKPPPGRVGSPPPPPTGTRPANPPLSPSRRANPGVKRSRARAFDEPVHDSPPKPLCLETPRVPHQIDAAANPFYVSPRAAALPPLAPSPPPSPPATTDVNEPDLFLPSKSDAPAAPEVLRLPSPPPVMSKKRAHPDSPASTPLKSCLSSSPLRSGSSDMDSLSTSTTPKKNKRVKLTPPGPETPSAAASFHIEDPAQRPPQDPTVSPKRMPPVVDLKVLAKKFKSPRKKVVKRDNVDTGEGAVGIRDYLVSLPPEPLDDNDAAQPLTGLPQLARFTGVPAFKLSAATPSRIPLPSASTSISRPRVTNRGGAAAPTLSSLAKATPKVATKTLSTLSKASSLALTSAAPPSAALKGRSLYPSSLSTRPAATRPVAPLPSARKTSVPLPSAGSTSRPPSPRAVSAPVLSQGLSVEGRTAMKGLAESLAKLNVRRSVGGDDKSRRSTGGVALAGPRPSLPPSQPAPSTTVAGVPMGPPSLPVPGRRVSGLPVSRRVSAASSSLAPADTSLDAAESGPSVSLTDSKSRASLASIAAETPACTTLKGVVAFVDVKTAEGDEAGGVFVEMLKNLGARVLTRPTESVTHIIFKGGRPTTLAFYRKSLPRPPAFSEADEDEPSDEANTSYESGVAKKPQRVPPALVGIGWVIRCREEKAHVSEDEYRVDLREQSVFQKRRKSMEPKHMFATAELPSASAHTSVQQSIDQARRRSMQFAPRVGSPLKKAYVHGDA